MKFITICSLLLVFCAVVGLVPTALATPSRDSGGNSWRGGSPGSGRIQNRPFIYDAPIRRPGQPETRYSEKIFKLATAQDNVNFLKSQRENLKQLRNKIIKERVSIKEKMNQLDEQIETIKKKNSGRNMKDDGLKNFHENFGELMERLLNSLCRTTPRILQLQRSQFQQNVKYYRINDDRAALKQIQKQLGFLKSKAIDERHQLDEKIAELQKRIERVKRKMRQVDKKSKKSEK